METILIVDDTAPNRKLLRAIVEAEEFAVFEASDGIEALAVLGREKIDAIISDILMPGMDGYRFCYEVRAHPRFFATPLVFYTGTYTSPDDKKFAIEIGADSFLEKPASALDIVKTLRKTIETALHPEAKQLASPQEAIFMKEYSERLVAKLEQRNEELGVKIEALLRAEEHMSLQSTELRLTHGKLRQLLAYSPAVIYTLKIEGSTLAPGVVSDNIERLLGFTVAESSHHDWWLGNLHPDDRDRVLATLIEALTKDGYSMEYRLRHKDGTYRWVEDNNRMVRDAAGRASEAVGVWTDITQRKKAEEVFKQRTAELERFHRLSVGRELRMIDLKKEVNELAILAGQPPPYDLSLLEK